MTPLSPLDIEAIQRFGTTIKYPCLGFILRNGQALNFCEHGHGRIEHDFVTEIPDITSIQDFLDKSGAVRVTPDEALNVREIEKNQLGLNLSSKWSLSPEQKETIAGYVRTYRPDKIYLDYTRKKRAGQETETAPNLLGDSTMLVVNSDEFSPQEFLNETQMPQVPANQMRLDRYYPKGAVQRGYSLYREINRI